MENSSDTIGNRTRDLPTCNAVPQPTALPRAPRTRMTIEYKQDRQYMYQLTTKRFRTTSVVVEKQ